MKNLVLSTIVLLGLIVVAGFVPGSASAESLVVDYTLSQQVSLVLNGNMVNDYTAEFRTNLKDNNNQLVRDANGNVVTYTGFCVDIFQSISPETVAVTLVAPSQVAGGLEAAWLIENRKSYTNVNANWSAYEIAALQTAIWEVMVDYNKDKNYSLTMGNFMLQSSANTQVRDLASYYLAGLKDFKSSAALDSKYRIAQNPYRQDLILTIPGASAITDNPSTAAVPEPGTLLLLGIGLLGIFGISRKRRN